MKKSLILMGIVLLSIALAACSNKANKATKETETSTSVKDKQTEVATFKGKIAEIPVIDEGIVSLTFDKVEAINDPDEIVNNLNSNGVILLAPIETFDDSLKPEDVAIGHEVTFELETPAAMTFSLPPQIPGSSIKLITNTK